MLIPLSGLPHIGSGLPACPLDSAQPQLDSCYLPGRVDSNSIKKESKARIRPSQTSLDEPEPSLDFQFMATGTQQGTGRTETDTRLIQLCLACPGPRKKSHFDARVTRTRLSLLTNKASLMLTDLSSHRWQHLAFFSFLYLL